MTILPVGCLICIYGHFLGKKFTVLPPDNNHSYENIKMVIDAPTLKQSKYIFPSLCDHLRTLAKRA